MPENETISVHKNRRYKLQKMCILFHIKLPGNSVGVFKSDIEFI